MRFAPVLLVPAAPAPPDVVRTADYTLRGLKATEFPRVKPLAPNVYSFERIDPTKRTVTANNLIVITTEGVPAHGFVDGAAILK